MALSIKDRPGVAGASPALSEPREKLHEHHAELKIALVDQKAAKAAEDSARQEYWDATDIVSEIQARIEGLADKYNKSHFAARDDIMRSIEDAKFAREEAKKPLYQLGIDREAAETRAKEADNRVSWIRTSINSAAVDVVRHEAGPIAEALVAKLQAAFATILEVGPTFEYLNFNGKVPSEVVLQLGAAPARLLNIASATCWPEFAARVGSCPWNTAVSDLIRNPAVVLPGAAD